MSAGMVYYCYKRQNAMVRRSQGGQAGPLEFNNLNQEVPVIDASCLNNLNRGVPVIGASC